MTSTITKLLYTALGPLIFLGFGNGSPEPKDMEVPGIWRQARASTSELDPIVAEDTNTWKRTYDEPEPAFVTSARTRNQRVYNGRYRYDPYQNEQIEPAFVTGARNSRYRQEPRRLVYYAELPDDTKQSGVYPRGTYDRSLNYDRVRSPSVSVAGPSYTIVDAERDGRQWGNGYQSPGYLPRTYPGQLPYARSQYPPFDGSNRIPAPYQYQGQRPNDFRPRAPLSVVGGPGVPRDLYRDYNPRQPAPWSVQIGTKLTVKDDGRPMAPGRRSTFYVHSQPPPQLASRL